MIFDSRQEREELVEEVSKTLRANKPKKKKPEDRDEDPIGGEMPLDEVLPPSAGHEVGERVPNTSSKNQPYYGGMWIEGIEERLCKLLEAISTDGEEDQTLDSQKDVRQGQVGTIGVLGHSKGTTKPATIAAAQRHEVDPYAASGKAKRETEEEKKEKETEEEKEEKEEMSPKEKLQSAVEKLGVSGIDPSGLGVSSEIEATI